MKGKAIRHIFFLAVALALFPSPGLAQRGDHAVARYDEHGKMSTLFSIYGFDNAKESKCDYSTTTGTIGLVEYDSKGQIISFYLNQKVGKPMHVYLSGVTVDKRLPADEIKRMPTLIRKTARVRLRYYYCGAGEIKEAEEITALH